MANNLRKTKNGSKETNNSFDQIAEQVQEERDAAPVTAITQDVYDLVAGYKDRNGTLHTTFTIRDVNGEDEEYLGRFQKTTQTKLISALVERCCESIGTLRKENMSKRDWHELIQDLYIADLDYIALCLRATSVGELFKARHTCPECKQSIDTEITMDEFNIVDWDGKDGVEFELEKGIVDKDGHLHKSGIIRYTRVRDRDASIAIASRNGARATTILLHHLVEFDDGYKPSEREITLMSTRDRNLLGNLLNDNAFGVDMSIDVECPNCGNIFKGVVANFTL